MQYLKRNDINEYIYKIETDLVRLKRTNLQLLSVGEGYREGIVREFGMFRYSLLYLK